LRSRRPCWKSSAYPGRLGHNEAHAGILEQIAELERGMKDNPSADNLVRFFENWFLKHVLQGDREYVAFIRNEMPQLVRA
jgi:hemerythrin